MNIFYFIYFLFDVVSINCMIKQLQSITFLHIEIIKSLLLVDINFVNILKINDIILI